MPQPSRPFGAQLAHQPWRRVKQAARVRPGDTSARTRSTATPELGACRRKLRDGRAFGGGVDRLVAIGASTGGPEALRHVLRELEAPRCALVVCQHMPERFMGPFAERLDSHCSLDIRLAEDGEPVRPGRGYVAPGDRHLSLVVSGGTPRWRLSDTDPLHGHRPAVDVLFDSVAAVAADRSVAVLLTGMGEDGAAGLVRARERGSLTLVQDEHSSAVWGMPGRAWKMGGGDAMLDLPSIGPALTSLLGRAA